MVHTLPEGQAFPPEPRQPSTHVFVATSQTRPLVAPPQSLSARQSKHWPMLASVDEHVSPAGHLLPPEPRQPFTHVLLAEQTLPLVAPPQSPSARHSKHCPIDVSTEVHTLPAWQPLPPEPRQPFTHVLLAEQTLPLVAPPQSLSARHSKHCPIDVSTEVHTLPAWQPFPPVPRQPSAHVLPAVQTLPLVAPPQLPSTRQPTQTFGETPVSQTGVVPPQSAFDAHRSTTTVVGGLPAAGPLPSVGVVLFGAPSKPPALMLAWFERFPEKLASIFTLNVTFVVAFTASVPPVVAFAPAPSRTRTVRLAASYSP